MRIVEQSRPPLASEAFSATLRTGSSRDDAEPAQVDIDPRAPAARLARRDAFRPSLVRVLSHDLLVPPFGEHREVDLAGGDRTRLPVDSIDAAVPDQQILPGSTRRDMVGCVTSAGSDLGERWYAQATQARCSRKVV